MDVSEARLAVSALELGEVSAGAVGGPGALHQTVSDTTQGGPVWKSAAAFHLTGGSGHSGDAEMTAPQTQANHVVGAISPEVLNEVLDRVAQLEAGYHQQKIDVQMSRMAADFTIAKRCLTQSIEKHQKEVEIIKNRHMAEHHSSRAKIVSLGKLMEAQQAEVDAIKHQMTSELEVVYHKKSELANEITECRMMKDSLADELKEVRQLKVELMAKTDQMFRTEVVLNKSIEEFEGKMDLAEIEWSNKLDDQLFQLKREWQEKIVTQAQMDVEKELQKTIDAMQGELATSLVVWQGRWDSWKKSLMQEWEGLKMQHSLPRPQPVFTSGEPSVASTVTEGHVSDCSEMVESKMATAAGPVGPRPQWAQYASASSPVLAKAFSTSTTRKIDVEKIRQRLRGAYKKRDDDLCDDEVAEIPESQRRSTRRSRSQVAAHASSARFGVQLTKRAGLLQVEEEAESEYKMAVDSSELMSINSMLKDIRLQSQKATNSKRLRKAAQNTRKIDSAHQVMSVVPSGPAVNAPLPEEEDEDEDL